MNRDMLTEILNVQCDSNFRMRDAYMHLDRFFEGISREAIIALMQTAFWAGVEAIVSDEEFRSAVAAIWEERDK